MAYQLILYRPSSVYSHSSLPMDGRFSYRVQLEKDGTGVSFRVLRALLWFMPWVHFEDWKGFVFGHLGVVGALLY